jgi:predicted lipoprotein with Yx(FWY)xxD motif
MSTSHAGGMKRLSFALYLSAVALLAACGGGTTTTPIPHQPVSGGSVLNTATIDGGMAFVTVAGFAVYKSSGDTTPDKSNCNASCASVWPPVPPPNGTLSAPWSSFQRSDGSTQLAYKGKPLYTFVNDTQPGVATGNGLNGFTLARP